MNDSIDTANLRSILKSQYHASLAMLRESIDRCPDDLWLSAAPKNAFWQVAYHALFFTHLYLQADHTALRPWAQHQSAVQHPDGIADRPKPGSTLPLIPSPYTRAQALAYWDICDQMVDAAVDALDLHRTECGFPWYKVSKLEHQFVSIRHVQHHAAQLADRLRAALDTGVRWVGARPPGA
jgi:hypothetical protein